MKQYKNQILIITLLLTFAGCKSDFIEIRQKQSLNEAWKTIANDTNPNAYDGFEKFDYDDSKWQTVDIPHNWDTYHGYLRKVHGNRHGTAWYRKELTIEKHDTSKRYFLFFEGVGSYATVYVNGEKAGYHAGGRTTFTIDITDFIHFDKPNLVAVKAEHPAEIRDLPWVCGGCSTERGFSEGSQPMGVFRPVQLIVTNDIRIEPFGIHVWNDTTVNEDYAELFVTNEIGNYSDKDQEVIVTNTLCKINGDLIAKTSNSFLLKAKSKKVFSFDNLEVKNPTLWSLENPFLYYFETKIEKDGKLVDQESVPYGIRWISWPINRKDSTGQFLLNGKPVFINGIGEYEHMFGNSHAFSDMQIYTRVNQIQAAGFNAFRDAHQPHNLRYQSYFDDEGMLWWTQFSAHVWFDNPAFRENFKTLLREWVKERRNCPSNIVWGLQNESTLPTGFAEECVGIIREMDPTASSQRIITTCNGGTGTDWNVIQNWSGTYGGDPFNYDNEISEQWLNGEYGAWRSIDLHTEGAFNQNGTLSEDRMSQLLETKVRLAESVKDKCTGQFLWIFSSHDNPGRIQSGEALRDIDRVGPVNYKGLLTPWGEPVDAFYMYRSHYAPKETEPMVYIVSHTWPNRWKKTGVKDSITVYSNCDEVELFNDINSKSLGKIKNQGFGHPFVWEDVDIQYNVLYAKGYIDGKEVAEDLVVLDHLPEASGLAAVRMDKSDITKGAEGLNYLYRVNCGGADYIDANSQLWMADRQKTSDNTWGSLSWTDKFDNLPAFYGSQRRTFDPIEGTVDWKMFQTFRYGLNDLSFNFPVLDGEYEIELYFTEPWYGTGGGMQCYLWRMFDVAVNNEVVIEDLDIFEKAGHDKAFKYTCTTNVKGGELKIHFPKVKSGQAIISAIAIATKDKNIQPSKPSGLVIQNIELDNPADSSNYSIASWIDWGDKQYLDSDVEFRNLPSILFGACWIKTSTKGFQDKVKFNVSQQADVFIALDERISVKPEWMRDFVYAGIDLENDSSECFNYKIYSKRFEPGTEIILGENGVIPGVASNMYSVFAIPSSQLDAPTDQRPVTNYNVKDAKVSGSVKRRLVDGRHYIEITGNEEVEVEWQFYVGLASTYGIHFKFQNNSGAAVQNEMLIETIGGITMNHCNVEMYNKPNNWRTVKTSTGTIINAGDYKVNLKIKNAKGLLLQRMEVQ